MEITYAKERLEELKEKLKTLKNAKTRGINAFEAIGMRNQEIKHSYFLAWLLNPAEKHGLGNAFLLKFLRALAEYKNSLDLSAPEQKTNAELLAEIPVEALTRFTNDTSLKVETEKVLFGSESRMDIFIHSEDAKTLLVIENKVFTSTHDNQLERYQEQCAKLGNYKVIYVYLTPEGSAPIDIKDGEQEFRDKWCVLSYSALTEIMTGILQGLPKSKQNSKLRMLIEDYIEMININVLKKNAEIRAICKQIRRDFKDELYLINECADINARVIDYCAERLQKELCGFKILRKTDNALDFYTESVVKYFERCGERAEISEKRMKCRYCITGGASIVGGICLDKNKGDKWSKTQESIQKKFEPEKKAGDLYFTLKNYSVELLSDNDGEVEFDAVKDGLDGQLTQYINKLKKFETELSD